MAIPLALALLVLASPLLQHGGGHGGRYGNPVDLDAYIAPLVRCAPPANKPTRGEIRNCAVYLRREWTLLGRVRAILALGKVAMDGIVDRLREMGRIPGGRRLAFGHGVSHDLGHGLRLFASYHPSQQNTFTGKLTARGFDSVLSAIRQHLGTEVGAV